MADVSKSLTGVAGEYYVAFRLSTLSFAVGLTGRGTPRADLLVTNPENGKSLAVQVKTMRNAFGKDRAGNSWRKWRVGTPALKGGGSNFYWAFVDLKDGAPLTSPDVYFFHSSDLKSYSPGLKMYLAVYPDPPSPAKDVWFIIEEPDAGLYLNNFDVVQKVLTC